MRIATWNLERLCRQNRLAAILDNCKQVDADILILTETDTRIQPEFPYTYHTPLLAEAVDGDYSTFPRQISEQSLYIPALRSKPVC